MAPAPLEGKSKRLFEYSLCKSAKFLGDYDSAACCICNIAAAFPFSIYHGPPVPQARLQLPIKYQNAFIILYFSAWIFPAWNSSLHYVLAAGVPLSLPHQLPSYAPVIGLCLQILCATMPPCKEPVATSPQLETTSIHGHDAARVIIIGAGPSGLATAACLQQHGVPYTVIERAHCIASLWKNHTYDRLCMHTAKNCCELPFMPLPESYPSFLTRQQFIDYLEAYARKFHIEPKFSETVMQVSFDHQRESWMVQTKACPNDIDAGRRNTDDIITCKQYACKWLVVATGENAEPVRAHLPGLENFKGTTVHSCQYKNASEFKDKRVLVIGAGNSGMEIALDLVNSGSLATSIVARSPLHVLPREMFGLSTFSLAMKLCKILPVRFVDRILVAYSQLRFGDTYMYGLRRPKIGPLELKNSMGKTPILDVGTLSMIQSGRIHVKPAIDCISASSVRFIDNNTETYDALILATGYKSNVPSWLDDEDGFFTEQGLCRSSSAESWKGKNGLYAAGLSGRGLLRAIQDARVIGDDVKNSYRASNKT
ncbi:hypothetical protein GOP47_0000937 [Adiantum capillus-veneris]|uniref:Flavin-containing monooxygenase n=1 Tax=Adiantum capillus-veneris TaxID=13818 RepID=A0A9D4VFW8_ADICA|nr:hypothetical protein GOP47_0000937 [Adiantum capillus-veneris]